MNKKLNINDIKLLIPDYITGSLSDAESRIVENAINSNTEIAELYKDMKSAMEFVDSVKLEEPLPQYWNNLLPRIHERIEEKENKGIFRFPIPAIWKVILPIAAIILIAIIYKISFTPERQMTEKRNPVIEQKNKNENNTNIQKSEQNQVPEIKSNENKITENEFKVKVISKRKTPIKENTSPENLSENNKEKVKEEPLDSKLIEEFASVEVNNLSEVTESEANSYDEELESEIEKLNSNDKEILLEQLTQTNL